MVQIKKYTNNTNYLFLSVPIFFVSSLFYCLLMHFKEFNNYNNIQQTMVEIPVIFPDKMPDKVTENIGIAMALFSIDIPENVNYPDYIPDLPYRGLTTGDAFFPNKQVSIGDMAFTSWGILGSTLGHEIEVHGKQSFLKIEFLNFLQPFLKFPEEIILKIFPSLSFSFYGDLGFGSYLAEKEAYTFEMNSMKRFHLTTKEVFAIKDTLDNNLI